MVPTTKGTWKRARERASVTARPLTTISGSPSKRLSASRIEKTKAMRSACTRRATNANTSEEAWSSHCASSTAQTSGPFSAASESSPRAARPDNESDQAAAPSVTPNATSSAARCGAGKHVAALHDRPAQLLKSGEGELLLRLDTGRPQHLTVARRRSRSPSMSAVFPDPRFAADDQPPLLCPLRAGARAASSSDFGLLVAGPGGGPIRVAIAAPSTVRGAHGRFF